MSFTTFRIKIHGNDKIETKKVVNVMTVLIIESSGSRVKVSSCIKFR